MLIGGKRMPAQAAHFFERHNINIADILYIVRENGKTAVHLRDNRIVSTYVTFKDLLSNLPQDDYLHINKGVALATRQIVGIDRGVYTMTDGRSFRGRLRNAGEHKLNKKKYSHFTDQASMTFPQDLCKGFSILDNMPIPFCVIELVFDKAGHGADFVFRYCNPEMETLSGIPVEDMLNRSFYEIFKNGDKKWLPTYADVALNGKKRIIQDCSVETDLASTIYCFQPEEGFCALALLGVPSKQI